MRTVNCEHRKIRLKQPHIDTTHTNHPHSYATYYSYNYTRITTIVAHNYTRVRNQPSR